MSSLRLKEQDELINHIRRLYQEGRKAGEANPVLFAFTQAQGQLDEHYAQCCRGGSGGGAPSQLSAFCPSITSLFLRQDVLRALAELDGHIHLSSRLYVAPTFSEVRTILNYSVVNAAAPKLQLLTLDADDTLYEDGGNLSFNSPNIPYLIRLLRMRVHVAVVTAAAYPGAPERYENRLAGLLSAMAFAIEAGAPPGPLLSRFWIMGGQCNYLMRARCSAGPPVRVYLEEIPGAAWKRFRGVRWNAGDVKATLDVAEGALRATAAKLHLLSSIHLIRKERAVGIIAKDNVAAPLSYEVLEELTLATQAALEAAGSKVPTCAFNGGHDVFVDIGSKFRAEAPAIAPAAARAPSPRLHFSAL
jgi:IMP and pyridine-specific 5'-nucleotidase